MKFSEHETTDIYAVVDQWRDDCLLGDGSLVDENASVWSLENVVVLFERFNEQPLTDNRTFMEKLKEQVGAEPAAAQLASEVLLVHFLFAADLIGGPRKRQLVNEIRSWAGADPLPADTAVHRAMNSGIGNPGQGFNTARDQHVAFLIDFTRRFKELAQEERQRLLSEPWEMRDFADQCENPREMRHILLHLLFPREFERIASRGHKRSITSAFEDLLPDDPPEDLDERLFAIRERLEELMPEGTVGTPGVVDFYHAPLRALWWTTNSGEDLDDLEALEYKRQLVFYGPPGTGKTHEARELAQRIIRRHTLHDWKIERYITEGDKVDARVAGQVRRLQLHPAYSYEDFIGGLRLTEGGGTEYRPGYLPELVDTINAARAQGDESPWVLILDEMNRADLARLLGEAFSLLEDRDSPVELAGAPESHRALALPANLFVIGTMNLIDQSVEQLDFALRRRFLWRFSGFDPNALLTVLEQRWNPSRFALARKRRWEHVARDLEWLADRASALNDAIAGSAVLGRQYEIGHTYFFDVLAFIDRWASGRSTVPMQDILWMANGRPRDPLTWLWSRALAPLLEQYLAGVDANTRDDEIERLRTILLTRPV